MNITSAPYRFILKDVSGLLNHLAAQAPNAYSSWFTNNFDIIDVAAIGSDLSLTVGINGSTYENAQVATTIPLLMFNALYPVSLATDSGGNIVTPADIETSFVSNLGPNAPGTNYSPQGWTPNGNKSGWTGACWNLNIPLPTVLSPDDSAIVPGVPYILFYVIEIPNVVLTPTKFVLDDFAGVSVNMSPIYYAQYIQAASGTNIITNIGSVVS